jgi:hypothetical protein
MLFSPTIGAAMTAGYWFLWVRCPACRTTNAIDLRRLDRHRAAAVSSLIPALSCRSCRPNALLTLLAFCGPARSPAFDNFLRVGRTFFANVLLHNSDSLTSVIAYRIVIDYIWQSLPKCPIIYRLGRSTPHLFGRLGPSPLTAAAKSFRMDRATLVKLDMRTFRSSLSGKLSG